MAGPEVRNVVPATLKRLLVKLSARVEALEKEVTALKKGKAAGKAPAAAKKD